MKEEKTKKRNSILKLIMDAFVLLLFSTTCCIQDMAIIPLVHISSKLNNLVKFYSIDLDLAAAGIDQGSMIEQFKKIPSPIVNRWNGINAIASYC